VIYDRKFLRLDGKELTVREAEILEILLENRGKPLTRVELADKYFEKYCIEDINKECITENNVAVLICRINKKINIIQSKYKVGYYIEEEIEIS
jgi:DNA-binding response OmpR family regulator